MIKKVGMDGTLKVLRANTRDVLIEDKYVMELVQIVCDEFSIAMDELLYDRYVRGHNKYAIGFCLYYLYDDYSLGELQKKGLFKYKDKSVLSRYRQLIEKLDPKHRADTTWIKIKDKLDIKVKTISQYKK